MAPPEKPQEETEARALEKAFLDNTLQSQAGRRFFYELFERAGIFSFTFDPDERKQTYQAGAYDLVKTIYIEIVYSFPSSFRQMMDEANARHTNASRRANTNPDSGLELFDPGPDLFDGGFQDS